jgi:hypothetical protein
MTIEPASRVTLGLWILLVSWKGFFRILSIALFPDLFILE